MPDQQISELTAVSELDGTELIHTVQDGNSRKASVDDLFNKRRGPYPNDRWQTIHPANAANPPFYWNISDTTNAGNASRPNSVMNFGYNLGPGGGLIDSKLGFFGMGFEGHYEPAEGTSYYEWHIYQAQPGDGLQRRPDSMRNSKVSFDDWTRMFRANTFTITRPDTQIQFFGVNTGLLVHYVYQDPLTREPSKGYQITGAGNEAVYFRPIGKAPVDKYDLRFNNWTNIELSNAFSFQTGPRHLNWHGQGIVGTDAGKFRIAMTAHVGIGRYGGLDSLTVDTTNHRVGIGYNNTAPAYAADIRGSIGFRPGHAKSQTPLANGDLVIETTSNTVLTFKYKGTDGIIRVGTVALA